MPSKRFGLPRVSRRVGIGLVAAAAIGGGIAYGVAPSGAAPDPTPTATISFTNDGPSPASLEVPSGTEVIFANDVDPNAGSALGTVSGTIKSVSITINGVTQKEFTLAPGQRANVGPYFAGSAPVVLSYRSTYDSTLVAGLVPGPQTGKPGTLTIDAAPPVQSNGADH